MSGAFSHQPAVVDIGYIVANNIYLRHTRRREERRCRAASLMAQRKIDASPVHTHTFALDEPPTWPRYARDRIDGAIKVVIKPQVARGADADKPVHAFAES